METLVQEHSMTIGLSGNPNCGKTTMFNALTGSHQHVGNWPGVTVVTKMGHARVGSGATSQEVDIVDLPGTYSLTAYSEEEKAARNFLINTRPAAVIDVMNADALERNLYLAVQILELGVPLVLALNMMDEVRKHGKDIDTALLTKLTGCPAIETVARSGKGKQELLDAAFLLAKDRNGRWDPLVISYGPDLDPVLAEMEAIITKAGELVGQVPPRWVGIKILEGDESIINRCREANPEVAARLEALVAKVSEHLGRTLRASPDAIIADYRYGYITGIARQVVRYPKVDAERIRLSDRMDQVLTHQLAGPLVMALVIYLVYILTFKAGALPMEMVQDAFAWLGKTAEAAMPDGLLRSLVVSGVIAGVGGVLGFVPLIMIMFFLISALEDSGYVARMAYMLDRVFRIFGLHGTSVLPFIVAGGIAGGCAVPGVMATRALRSPKEKLATLLVTPFMTCGAKVPVFLMLAAAFFPGSEAGVMSLVTLTAWVAALLVAKLLRSTVVKGESTPFVMELPPYRMPTLSGLCIHTWERSWDYMRKAGTTILAISVLLWAAMTFPGLPADRATAFDAREAAVQEQIDAAKAQGQEASALEEALKQVGADRSEEALKASAAGRAGVALESVSHLAGFNWRVNIALVGGLAAKEVIVSTLGTAYSLGEIDTEDAEPLSRLMAADPSFPRSAALALIIFVILYAPCSVTIVTMARESSWKWAVFAMTFNTSLAFVAAVAVFQTARLFS
ncbi:MAG: ferrous iron transport protein B [Humidesulfovibrio sp.]|uniref:ferrous iron transport protein B n=1 Tax=Humidesulfovibrio sp. TaxID=2910988 RepID=UPI0027E9DD38|nr:ferrous iron transport protein B [Humidesulfovibrio sp.]MDQ7835744.1 ferrous iron transport protein B [Humidesulfovibrio sp.]